MGAGPVKARWAGVHLAVHGRNAALQRIEAIQRGDIAAFQTRVDFIGGGPKEFGHLAFLKSKLFAL